MFSQEEIEKAFEGCTSNLDAPLMGEIITPECYHCKNFVWPENVFRECTCKILGEIPVKYRDSDTEHCPHKVLEEDPARW